MDSPIYLDHNATTPLLPAVERAMAECRQVAFANPASQHTPGRAARRQLEQARAAIGRAVGAEVDGRAADTVVLTSGATESNHLALLGMARALEHSGALRLAAVAAIEHPSSLGPAELLAESGWTVLRLGVNRHGVVSLDDAARLLAEGVKLVSVALANHETGVLQPVAQIADLCRQAGAHLHTDATQAVGKMPVDFRALGVSTLAASAHKLHGPCGVGLLVVGQGVPLEPLWRGGFQQGGLRPGTEPVALAAGFRAAIEAWQAEVHSRPRRIAALRDRLQQALIGGWPSAVVAGEGADRAPQTLCVALTGLDRQALVLALDQAGVACSSGSACASGSSEPSPVLLAMGWEKPLVDSALRLSLGATTTESEVDEAAGRILRICNHLRRQKSGRFSA